MGILQSVIRYLGSETDEEEKGRARSPLFTRGNAISSPNSFRYYSNTGEKSEYPRGNNDFASSHEWQNGNCLTQTQQRKYLAISVPNLRNTSSLVKDKETYLAVLTKERAPQNVSCQESVRILPSSGGKGGENEREKGQVMINCMVARPLQPPQGRWIKHYSSCHQILLVGEGDFSFSACLAAAFGLASNMITTSLDSEAFLVKNYQNAMPNLVELSIRKCKVMHEIDATKMANHAFLGGFKFDRIIFNFPFAGFFKNLSREAQLQLHRRLVSLFLKNAKEMISENGEIHISHKTNCFHKEWYLETIASLQGLRLIKAVDFNLLDYPGYSTKCGFGGDNNFDCNPSKTYKFGLKC